MSRKRRRKNNKGIILFGVILIILAGIVFYLYNGKNNNETITASTNITTQLEINETENIIENKEEESNTIDLSKLADEEKLGSEGLPVLMYHFFYDESKGETGEDGNWLEASIFESHLKYLTENNFYFPTWEQVSDYIDGKIDLPKKSVVLTVDDGEDSFFKVALPIVKKYDVKVTEFLVTSWNGWYKNDYPAKQMVYQSHSDDMHKPGEDGDGAMVNWSYSKIVEDLKKSKQMLGDECITFCYPFGHYNDTAIKALKDTGFKLAFTTEYGRVKVGDNKYELPRIRTSSSTTLEVFKDLVN